MMSVQQPSGLGIAGRGYAVVTQTISLTTSEPSDARAVQLEAPHPCWVTVCVIPGRRQLGLSIAHTLIGAEVILQICLDVQ